MSSSVKTAIPLFNDGMKKLESFDQGVKPFSCLLRRRKRDTCVVLDISPRLTQSETHVDTFEKTIRRNSWKQRMDQVPGGLSRRYVSHLVPSQFKKVFGCCWTSSDLILFDEITEKS